MKEKGNKSRLRAFLAGLLAVVLALTPALSALPSMETQAADQKIWYSVTGAGGNGHDYESDTSAAAVLLNQDATMPEDGIISLVFQKQGDTISSARVGVFYTYVDEDNWLFIGNEVDGTWFYQYRLNGSGSYASFSALDTIDDDTEVKFTATLSHEVLTVTVNDSKDQVSVQNLYTLATKAAGEGKFGFRASGSSTQFRFRDVAVNGESIESNNWDWVYVQGTWVEEDPIDVYTVSGKVEDESGNPIEGAKVYVASESGTTDANGAYEISGVEAGTQTINISASGYQDYSAEVEVTGDNQTLPVAVLQVRIENEYDTFIESDEIRAAVSTTFPQVYKYELLNSEKYFYGQEDELTTISINGTAIEPVMDNVTLDTDSITYEMTLQDSGADIDMSMTVKISVSENDLTWEVTDITKADSCDTRIKTIEVENLNLVTVRDTQSEVQFEGATISGNTNSSGDVEITFEDGFSANKTSGYAYGFISADGVSAGVWSNSEAASDKRVTYNSGTSTMALTSSAWYYEEGDITYVEGTPVSELPCAKVCLAEDENGDGTVDWQDGAIAYRDIMNNPDGSEDVPDLVNYRIVMNFSSQATNPYLKTADNIKKVYLATDGLGQAVMIKGYGSEGHDSANSEYGNIGERIGGLEDLQELITIAHQYSTEVGIHINAQEMYPEAQSFSDSIINGTSSTGWGWLDQSYSINRPYDLASGLRYKRMLQLYDELTGSSLYANAWPGVVGEGEDETVADAETIAATVAENEANGVTNLDFIYLDVWYGDSYETRKIADQINSLGWRFTTEFGYEGEYDSTWQHWATEGSYGGSTLKGLNSDVIRFIRNHQKDSFVLNYPSYGGAADNPLLGGYDLSGFEGWGSSNYDFGTYMTRTYAVNLPTKFLQHYEVTKWVTYSDLGETSPVENDEKEITLENDEGDVVVVTRNEEQREDDYVERTITLNGRVVLDDVTYLLPWEDSETGEEKLYHYNYDGGTTSWELSDDWASLANVVVYKLTDTGRTEETTVDVVDGWVTLTAEADTPYIVVKGEEAAKVVTNFGEGQNVTDPGFNSYDDGDSLDESVWVGDTDSDAVSVVCMSTENKYLQMGSEDEEVAVSTLIKGLTPGEEYVAQVYVSNLSDAKAWIEVSGVEATASNYTLYSLAQNYVQSDAHRTSIVTGYTYNEEGEAEAIYGTSTMQTMQVSFTATSSSAILTLRREAGSGVTYFDDIRVVEKTLGNEGDDGTFTQGFEEVVSGIYPFVIGAAQGVTDNTTHLSELNDPYTQSGWGNVVLDDVISGNWSLKYHHSNGASGLIYRTIPQNYHFEAGKTYTVSFNYQCGPSSGFRIVIGDENGITDYLDMFGSTAASGAGQKSTTESFTFTFTASDSGQSWFGLYTTLGSSNTNAYGYYDFVMDDLVIKETGLSLNKSTVTLSGAGDTQTLTASDTVMLWSSSNLNVVTVTNGQLTAVGAGEATITAMSSTGATTCTVKVVDDMTSELVSAAAAAETVAYQALQSAQAELTAAQSALQAAKSAYASSSTSANLAAVSAAYVAVAEAEYNVALANVEYMNALVLVASSNALTATTEAEIESTKTAYEQAQENADAAEKARKASISGANDAEQTGSDASDAISQAEAIDSSQYTSESYAAVQTALQNLKLLLADANASQQDIADAVAALQTATSGLVQGSGSSGTGTDTSGGSGTTGTTGTTGSTVDTTTNTPATTTDELKVGDTVTLKNITYKVTSVSNKTVTVVKGTKKKATSVTIPATVTVKGVSCKVTAISAKAFRNFTKLKKVTIGKNVTTIGKQAFYGCKKLTKISFKGKAVKTVKSGAFKNVSAKVKVSIPKSLKGKKRSTLIAKLKKAGIKSTIK